MEPAPTSARGRIIIRCTVGLPLGERDLRVPIRRSALVAGRAGAMFGVMFGAHDLHSRTSLNNERATLGLPPATVVDTRKATNDRP